ncbi:MAG: PilZ domain-containing protein [Planctomycetota bacterium]|jgi:c-di-GMP-binding flagellar brake protein YcgR
MMTHNENLNSDQIQQFLADAAQGGADVVVSYTADGKWQLAEMKIVSVSEESVTLKGKYESLDLKTYQPVGICTPVGFYKYLFESSVQDIQATESHLQIRIECPEKATRMKRRAFDRQPVPANLKVKVLFWHRGYLDDTDDNPLEQYWQGRLFNLSAGGAQITVDLAQKDNYKVGQLVGVQFTPMSYEKPLLLEAHVRYLMMDPEGNQFRVGVEFLGLEASPEGRQSLNRLVDITNEYERMNAENHSVST